MHRLKRTLIIKRLKTRLVIKLSGLN